jgi:hypothetical protein
VFIDIIDVCIIVIDVFIDIMKLSNKMLEDSNLSRESNTEPLSSDPLDVRLVLTSDNAQDVGAIK